MTPWKVRLFAIEQVLIEWVLAASQGQVELELAFKYKDQGSVTEELQGLARQMKVYQEGPTLFACLKRSFTPKKPKIWLLAAAFIILYQILDSLPCQRQT